VTGLDADAYVRVLARENDQTADVQFAGYLAAGQTQQAPVPLQGPGPVSRFRLTGPGLADIGSPFTLTVTAQDDAAHTLPGYTGRVHFASSDSLAGLPADYTFTAGDQGVKTFTGLVLRTAGYPTITVSDTTNANILGTTAVGVSGPATHFSVSAPNTAYQGVPALVTVIALDAGNRVASGYAGTVHFSSGDGLSQLPADFPFPAEANGRAVFPVTWNSLASQTLLVADTANSAVKGSASVAVAPGLSCAMTALPAYSAPAFTVRWTATDFPAGGGIVSYDVYVSTDGGPFAIWQRGTTQTSVTYAGVANRTYRFYALATDAVGAHSATPAAAQATTQTLLDTASKQWVAAVYQDVLGRAPDLGGLLSWARQLDQGANRTSLATKIATSSEYYTIVIRRAYQQFLGRQPDAKGLASWLYQMQHGLTDEWLESHFIASPEYYRRAGNTDKGWVNAMYQDLLGRRPDPVGEANWLYRLAHGARRLDVAHGFAASKERETLRIQADYRAYLGRDADPQGLANWLNAFLHGKTNEDLIAAFVGSDEYYRKHTGA
jgi:hypothetical protein